MKPRIIAIAGPTASGKTDLSIQIAQKLKTEVISFDSRQFYQELNIGVARPTHEQLTAVKHHFIANRSIHNSYSAASFSAEARAKINNILCNHEHVVLCGGTGLYLKALLEGFSLLPETTPKIRDFVESVWAENGIKGLLELIDKRDSDALQRVELKNPARLKRAAELLLSSDNQTLQEIYAAKTEAIEFSYRVFKLMPEKEALYQRIEKRVDVMMQEGLLKEVNSLLHLRKLPVLKTVGYSELFDYLEGKIKLEEAVDKIKQHTRNYAKRQITWFKNQTEGISLQPDTAADAVMNSI